MLVKLVCWLLKGKQITTKEREILTSQLLRSLNALPTHAIITRDEGKLFINGIEQDGIRASHLRESADQALHNIALQAVHEQVLYQAVSIGVHQAQTTEQMQFAKAAIWYGQEETKLLKTLATPEYANSPLSGD